MQGASYSVLMSVYKKENASFFRAAVDSMLGQTVPPTEFVLICDGPMTDALETEITALKRRCTCLLKVVRIPECKGLGNALRTGLENCTCQIVARMDSDDLAVPNRMELQLARLEAHPEVAVVGGQIAEFQSTKEKVIAYRCVPCSDNEIRKFASQRNPMNHMTVTFRRDAVLCAGNYRTFDRFEDYDLWARMLSRGYHMMNLDEVLVYARVAPDTYRRRGGLDYFYQTVQMQKHLRVCGLIGYGEYWRNLFVRFAGTVLLPNRLRSAVYLRHLRGQSANGGAA